MLILFKTDTPIAAANLAQGKIAIQNATAKMASRAFVKTALVAIVIASNWLTKNIGRA